jgi:hypothetical protein
MKNTVNSGMLRLDRNFTHGTALLAALILYPTLVSAQLPNLSLNRARTAKTISIERRSFSADHCAVIERCVRASGKRSILRFDVAVVNVGSYDLVLGDPRSTPELYEWSPCHGHYHFRGLITYEILNLGGQVVFTGAKQAFCLRDNYKYLSTAPESHGYDCDYQGLTAGWEDVYDRSLDCQWIDVTGIKSGIYKLRATVNKNRKVAETNYRNNVIVVQFVVPAGKW